MRCYGDRGKSNIRRIILCKIVVVKVIIKEALCICPRMSFATGDYMVLDGKEVWTGALFR